VTALPVSTYVGLTTFRRTGVPVATPVRAAPDGGSLVVCGSRPRPEPHPERARAEAPSSAPP
jgi:hypothetical protein